MYMYIYIYIYTKIRISSVGIERLCIYIYNIIYMYILHIAYCLLPFAYSLSNGASN